MWKGGLWVCSSVRCEKGIIKIIVQKRIVGWWKIKVRASVHSFWFAKPLGEYSNPIHVKNDTHFINLMLFILAG